MAAVKSSLVLVLVSLIGLATCQIYNVEFPTNFNNKVAPPVLNGEAPYNALLLYEVSPTTMQFQSVGIIYGEDHMVTTATNLRRNDTNKYFVYAGKLNIGPTINRVDLSIVDKITIHSGFDQLRNKDNIAILRVTTKFTMGVNLRAATITNRLTQGNETCMMSSWRMNNTVANLVKLSKATMERSNCTSLIGGSIAEPAKVICASAVAENDTCGIIISGAPLTCGGNVAGIALRTLNCTSGSLSVGANLELYHYRQWMADNSSSSITAGILTFLAAFLSIIKSNSL